MPKTPEIVSTFSSALGIAPGTVGRHVRYLREAGLYPAGLRGRRGRPAEVQPEHAANLLLSLMVGLEVNHGVAGAKVIGDLPAQDRALHYVVDGVLATILDDVADSQIPSGNGPAFNRMFGSVRGALVELFSSIAEGNDAFVDSFSVGTDWRNDPSANLTFVAAPHPSSPDGMAVQYCYQPTAPKSDYSPPIARTATIRSEHIMPIGAMFAEGNSGYEAPDPVPELISGAVQ